MEVNAKLGDRSCCCFKCNSHSFVIYSVQLFVKLLKNLGTGEDPHQQKWGVPIQGDVGMSVVHWSTDAVSPTSGFSMTRFLSNGVLVR